MEASHPLAAVREHFAVPLEAPPRVETVGGYLAWGLGRIPKAGERAVLGDLEFDVLEASPTRLVRLVVRATANGAGAGPAAAPPGQGR